MIHKRIVVGPLQCNCQLLMCERTGEAVLIDPGDEPAKILQELNLPNLKLKYLIHTHAHFDHFAATGGVKASAGGTILLHKADDLLWRNLPKQGQMFGFEFTAAPDVERFIEDDEEILFGDHKLSVLHTPGHSPGSICLTLSGGTDAVFSGDTLFYRGIGRADLWGGDGDQLLSSIRDRLFTLDGDLPVHPGHGPSTRLGDEKRENPFF